MSCLAEIEEVKKALSLIDIKWSVQNDRSDKETAFIYYCKRIDQVISLALSNEVNVGYAIHRWYNFQCSKWCEQMFCENGAEAYPDDKDHDIDLTIEGVPFDIKLSIISELYSGEKDLSNRQAKNDYIKWLKSNASQEQRKHTANKIFVIVSSLEAKCDIFPICDKIMKFIDYFKQNISKYNGKEICELIYVPPRKRETK